MTTASKYQLRTEFEAGLAESMEPNLDVAQIANSLLGGLSLIRDLLLDRIHTDVFQQIGLDSMVAPISARDEVNRRQRAAVETDIYMSIVAAEEIDRNAYVQQSEQWIRERLFELRLLPNQFDLCVDREEFYQSDSIEERRLKFLSILQRAAPESVSAPLVLFRLFPRAIRIVPAVAFHDPLRAQELRAEQCSFLPAVGDCNECDGRVLDNDEKCRVCGNPVWEFPWLQAD